MPATELSMFKLRRLPFSLRLAVASLVLCLAIGEAASLYHLVKHHEKKDDVAGLSLTDLEGAYHGVDQPSRLQRALAGDHGAEHCPKVQERDALLQWLAGARINQDYDNEDQFGELAPALILERRCVSCHARTPADAAGAKAIGATVPLEFWDDVARVAFEKKLDPVPLDLLAMSTHAHALTLPLVAFVVGLLCLATSWPRRLVRWLVALGAVGLLVDLVSWWLARPDFATWGFLPDKLLFVKALAAGGALFGVALAVQMALVLVDLMLPPPRDATG